MPSSSVNPENGVAAAAELLASYAAMPTRATDAESFVSFPRTQDEVDALCKMYGVPKEFTARPAGDLRANSTPPPGSICVYARALEAGMRVPLHGFFRDALAHLGVLAHFGIAPAQLTPNGWRTMAGFLVLCRSAGVPPLLAVFRRFFVMSSLCEEHEKGWYVFRPRRDSSGLRLRGLPKPDANSITWKHEFFFLSSPESWPCAVEWSERSNRSSSNPVPVLTVEESQSMLKLLSAHGGAAVDLRKLLPATCPRRRRSLRNTNLAAAMITTASSPPPPPPPPSSTRTDPSVHDTSGEEAEKAAAQASASAKKRTWEEANGGEEVSPLSVLSNVRSPPPQHFPSRHDRDTTKAARELLHLHGADAQPLERAFAANEPSDDAAIWQAANYTLELEQKLVASEREAAALREQLEKAKAELAAAKRTAEAEVVKTKAELVAAKQAAEAELAAKQAAEAEAVKMKAELAAAVAEAVKTKVELAAAKRATETETAKANAELAAANRAVEAELVKAKAKLAAAEAELESAKAATAVQELLASEEKVRRGAELALEGYERWRGRHAPAGRAV
ncbi:hypothetical protein VPH35_127490 [Triticum aestivum]